MNVMPRSMAVRMIRIASCSSFGRRYASRPGRWRTPARLSCRVCGKSCRRSVFARRAPAPPPRPAESRGIRAVAVPSLASSAEDLTKRGEFRGSAQAQTRGGWLGWRRKIARPEHHSLGRLYGGEPMNSGMMPASQRPAGGPQYGGRLRKTAKFKGQISGFRSLPPDCYSRAVRHRRGSDRRIRPPAVCNTDRFVGPRAGWGLGRGPECPRVS